MNVAIVGATGYGGIQAVNLLKKNKKYNISFLGGNKTSGSKWNDNFPFIYLDNDPYIEKISVDNITKNSDVALLCLPNGLSSTLTRKLLDRGIKVIDLSADYRYKSLDEWKKVIDINLTSTFLLSKFAIKKMLKNKSGKIVNITSVVGHTGNLGQANYTASKAGIVAMSKSLALEYAKKNINVNCISPGFIKTAMTDKLDQKFKELIISKIPSARLGDPSDIANAVLFLASDQSNYINGETIHINGGMYMA